MLEFAVVGAALLSLEIREVVHCYSGGGRWGIFIKGGEIIMNNIKLADKREGIGIVVREGRSVMSGKHWFLVNEDMFI